MEQLLKQKGEMRKLNALERKFATATSLFLAPLNEGWPLLIRLWSCLVPDSGTLFMTSVSLIIFYN